jgi:antitoxin CptB
MLNAEKIKDTQKNIEQRRLAWRCRRGMLELDIVLTRFVAQQFDALSLAEMHAFDAMLTLPDNVFWQMISANALPADAVQCAVIQKIKVA